MSTQSIGNYNPFYFAPQNNVTSNNYLPNSQYGNSQNIFSSNTPMNSVSAVETLSNDFSQVESANNGKNDGKFSGSDLTAIINNPNKYPPNVVKAAQFVSGNKDLMKQLEGDSKQSKTAKALQVLSFGILKPHKTVTQDGLEKWIEQNDPNGTGNTSSTLA